jgi:hypothetical protein
LKEEFAFALILPLASNDTQESDYILSFFLLFLFGFAYNLQNDFPQGITFFDMLCSIINDGLKAGDIRFLKAMKSKMDYFRSEYTDPIREAFENFKEVPQVEEKEQQEFRT